MHFRELSSSDEIDRGVIGLSVKLMKYIYIHTFTFLNCDFRVQTYRIEDGFLKMVILQKKIDSLYHLNNIM